VNREGPRGCSSSSSTPLPVAGLDQHPDYRGRDAVEVGHQVADQLDAQGWLDARLIGDAVHTGRWHARDLKRLWQCVARHGHPAL